MLSNSIKWKFCIVHSVVCGKTAIHILAKCWSYVYNIPLEIQSVMDINPEPTWGKTITHRHTHKSERDLSKFIFINLMWAELCDHCKWIDLELQINSNGVWMVHTGVEQIVDKETNTIFLANKGGKNKPLLRVYLGQDAMLGGHKRYLL